MGLMSSRDEPLHGEADGALLSAATLDALGLHGQPFLHTVPGHGRFVDDTSEAQLDDVRQALIAGDDLLLVLGPPGSGRSILLDVLNDDSGTRIQCFHVAGTERFDTDNLFAGMLEAFQQPVPEDLKLSLDELIPCLQGMDERNTLCVVIVDDAEAVDDNELTRLLSSMLYLNSGDETLLRMVFAASDDFEDRIPDLLPEGADLPYSILSMEPLEDDRAASFLAFRLAQAGHTDALPFDDEDVAMLNDRASGRPGTLQSLAAETLNERFGSLPAAAPVSKSFASSLPEMDDRRRKLLFGGVAAALILAGLLLFLPSPDDSGDNARPQATSASADTEAENAERLRLVRERANEERARELAAEEAAAARAETDQREQAESEALAQAAPEAAMPADGDRSTPAASNDAGTRGSDRAPADPADPPANASAGESAAASATTETAPSSILPAPVAEPADSGRTDGNDASADERIEIVPQTSRAENAARNDDADDTSADAANTEGVQGGSLSAEELAIDDPNPVAGDGSGEPIQTAEVPVETAPLDPPPEALDDIRRDAPVSDDEPGAPGTNDASASGSSSIAGSLESPNWILVQSPDQFTVQMIAAIDRESVDSFLQNSNLPSPNSVFSFERSGTVWYAMVHGLYPTIEAATAAIEAMPAELRSNEPWIRAIGRLQETVRN